LSLRDDIKKIKIDILDENIDVSCGMPEELFLFSTTLSPVVNVDLLVTNEDKQILLLWRDDAHNGKGWHIPGGCIRFKETIELRIKKCAHQELHSDVFYDANPIAVVEHIIDYEREIKDNNERAHFVSLAYKCYLPEEFELLEGMRWFGELPDDLLKTQEAYRKHWKEIESKL
jgi:colanic acid biosynthesis protein WcaH